MGLKQLVANAVRSVRRGSPPSHGRIIVPRAEDAWRDYPSSGLTPSRLMAILHEADAGSLSATMQLFEEMEEKDAHLYAVANTRRLAVTGLDWIVVIASDRHSEVDSALADQAAVYCREVLGALDTFDETLQHLSLAVGRNIALAELVWESVGGELRLVDTCPVDFGRIVLDDLGQPQILTADEPVDGIALPPNKFVVHTHHTAWGVIRLEAVCCG